MYYDTEQSDVSNRVKPLGTHQEALGGMRLQMCRFNQPSPPVWLLYWYLKKVRIDMLEEANFLFLIRNRRY